jgi:triosephosphate isomerase (TIM)
MRKPIIGGNWKLMITTLSESLSIFDMINHEVAPENEVEVFLAVPYTALASIDVTIEDKVVALGAQNVAFDKQGALTGEISIDSLVELGVKFVLIGHSERRIIFKESNEDIKKKLMVCLEAGITPVLCIGEDANEREAGKFEQVITAQILTVIKDLDANQIKNLVIAYEPVWAINNPLLNPNSEIKPATADQADQAHLFIRNILESQFNKEVSNSIRIIYGGSMNESNAYELLSMENIDGGLIGSASISAKKFIPIVKISKEIMYQREYNQDL